MRLVDSDMYALYTGDVDTDESTVDDALDEALQLLEEDLGRVLSYGTHTERLKVTRGACYPSVTPVESVLTDGTVDGDMIRDAPTDDGAWSAWTPTSETWATVTYIGGFTPATLPRSIARDVSACAQGLIRTRVPSQVPAGASSASVGDVAVSFGPSGAGAAAAGTFPWSPATRRWKRRVL